MNKFTFYWVNGCREVFQGTDVSDAFKYSGYSPKEAKRVAMAVKGDDHSYIWHNKSWIKNVCNRRNGFSNIPTMR